MLADDHPDFLALATRLLEPEFDVIHAVSNGQALVAEATRLKPDVVVTDISMPALNGIDAVRHLRALGSALKIIFLSVHEHPDYIRSAFAAGADGYVIKCRLASDLLPAMREVLSGRSFVSPNVSAESSK
jgi:DNA-binding NarL/FixJ family response regulator